MKIIFLIFLYSVARFSTQAQTSIYHEFPDSNAVWNIDESAYCFMLPFATLRYSIVMDGDTLIGGSNYHKLNIPYVDTTSAPCYTGYPQYAGSIREDVALKMVYIIPPDDSVEQVLYDFNLEVGDTVHGYLGSWLFPNNLDTVTAIDSILVGNSYRKRWSICPNYDIFIIEGVGSTFGLIEYSPGSMSADFTQYTVRCFKQNDTLLYPYWNTTCDLINTADKINQSAFKTSVFPNPFTMESTLTIDPSIELSDLNLSIYNSLGILTRNHKIVDHSTTIRKDDLPNGLYYLKILKDGLIIGSGKIIIK
ncbi:MAG: T9SS type A sorting domain-containing protein [Bacteroidetes bacterium]|jgi:hypothetical protein|nr:T9SS type A sorting domain-containing protein [Bacteroidota bacterium]MBP6428520.1 T9SS type A sorting domain-containing protein [Bacteroidia bacterium]MBK8362253.1 T9SS type A sorting domain-containing protein [Bacteroidota bacterium]MBK9413031.1 T9SS type A sorting domain-containing protein [Bacteroidota bacterium]MBL0032239.1 T9SS type A sorting domain-containing protein [Bacteroidota bacterium]